MTALIAPDKRGSRTSEVVTAFIAALFVVSTGRVQLIVFPQPVSPSPMGWWDILTCVIPWLSLLSHLFLCFDTV